MAILGLESVTYCVDDLDRSTDFFEDFGLSLFERTQRHIRFKLPDTSNVILRNLKSDPVPGSLIDGIGVHEVVWGVDCREHLDKLIAAVEADREIRRDNDGTAHFIADGGLPMALRLWPTYRMPLTSTDPVNTPGNTGRMNVHRKWIARANPKRMMHVVYMVPDTALCRDFMIERLDFRLTDEQRGAGSYLRCDGANDHHNIFFFDSSGPMAGMHGQTRFHHVNYHVIDLDEIMVGRNYMERRGWAKSTWGLGRHRIGSALFHYFPCPAGGEAEYGADGDQLDDGWIPRDWDALFGFGQWMHDVPEFWSQGADWDVSFAETARPRRGDIGRHSYDEAAE